MPARSDPAPGSVLAIAVRGVVERGVGGGVGAELDAVLELDPESREGPEEDRGFDAVLPVGNVGVG